MSVLHNAALAAKVTERANAILAVNRDYAAATARVREAQAAYYAACDRQESEDTLESFLLDFWAAKMVLRILDGRPAIPA